LRKGYFASIKRYSWIVLACTLLAILIGFLFLKIQPQVFQASSIMFVNAGAPGDTFDPTLSSNDSLGLATDYASEITSRTVMNYVYQVNPQLKTRGYGPDDLLADVIATPSATVANITITASAVNQSDAILLANDVATGFQSYVQTQRQQQLDGMRNNLQNQYNAALKQKGDIEARLVALSSNTDPHFAVYQADLTDVLHTMDTIQSQLLALPTTATSDVVALHLAGPKDAQLAVKSSLIIAVTGGIGLLVGISIMLLVIFLDNRLHNEEDVSEKLGVAYLGRLSTSKKLEAGAVMPESFAPQELADICANLRLTGVLPGSWHAPQGAILLVTSSQAAEGKTTLAAMLAATIVRAGRTTVVIDGNLRQPTTQLAFDINAAGPGLSGLLQSKGSVDNAVQRSKVPGLWLLPGGNPVESSTLLLEQNLPNILAQLQQKTDVIIIDGPSVLESADASVLASMADGVVLIVDARHDRLPLLLRAKAIVQSLTHTPIGVVMNRFPGSPRNSYFVTAYPTDATTPKNRMVLGPDGKGAQEGVSPSVPLTPAPLAPPLYNSFAGSAPKQDRPSLISGDSRWDVHSPQP
jgi:capsular exopolysaccharide synthesis family protein